MAKTISSLNLLALLTISSGLISLANGAWAQSPEVERSPEVTPPAAPPQSPPTAARGESEPATTVVDWQAQIEASLVQITNIQVEATETGLQVEIEADSELASPTQSVSGNALVL